MAARGRRGSVRVFVAAVFITIALIGLGVIPALCLAPFAAVLFLYLVFNPWDPQDA